MKTNLTACYRGGNQEGESGYWLSFMYDADLVEQFKQVIPHTHREWHPSTKLWWVSIEYDEVLQELFSNFYALIHQQRSLF